MADRIKNTQIRHTKERFIETGNKRDVLFPQQHQTISDPVGSEWRFIGANNAPVFGEQIIFDIPKSNYIGEMCVEFNLVAGTGNYTTYPALSIPDRVTLLNQSGNELHDYNYVSVMQSIFANMPDEDERTILEASGGTAFASGRCIAPIPFFGSSLAHRGKPQPPLPAHMLQGKMRLEINLKTLANSIDAGASGAHAISSVRLWYLHYNNSDEQRQRHFSNRASYRYKSVDWQTNVDTAITAATPTNVDISGFHGSLHTLYVMNKSTANKVTANDYYLLSAINDARLLADGDQLYDVDSRNSQLLLGYLHDRQVDDATLGDLLVINMGYADPMNKNREHTGSLHLNDINQLELDQLNVAATGVIDIVGEFDVEYVIDGSGNIRRIR